MTAGVVQRNPTTGEVFFEAGVTGIGKVLGRVITSGGAAGSLTDARFAAGVPFAFIKPTGSQTVRLVSFSGTTMSWNAVASNANETIFYGVGTANNPNYVSTHVAGTAGFRLRDEAGNFVIDETFFAYHLTAKIAVTPPQATHTVLVPLDENGELPLFAIRSTDYAVLLDASVFDATRAQLTMRCSSPYTLYFFGKLITSSGFAGIRWRSTAGVLMGDTSIPPLNMIRTNLAFAAAAGDWDAERGIAGTLPYRKYAIMINSRGSKAIITSGSFGPGSIETYALAGRIITGNPGTAEGAYVSGVLISSGPGSGTPGTFIVDGRYSLVDVTGL